jgi:hypothetical protein
MWRKLALLVLVLIMSMIVACSDDGGGSYEPYSHGGEPDQALIDNEFAPFSLLAADNCTLISVEKVDSVIGGGDFRSAIDYREYSDFTVAMCVDNNTVYDYKQALIDSYDFNDYRDSWYIEQAILGHLFHGVMKQISNNGTDSDYHFYASETTLELNGPIDEKTECSDDGKSCSYYKNRYLLLWGVWYGDYIDWDDIEIIPANSNS